MADARNDDGPNESTDEFGRPVPQDGDGADVRFRYEQSPSGWRRRTVRSEEQIRQPQTQGIEQHQRAYGAHFDRTQFVAYLSGSDMKFARNGDVLVTMRVPYEHRDRAIMLTDAFGLPLSVDIELWEPYREAAGG